MSHSLCEHVWRSCTRRKITRLPAAYVVTAWHPVRRPRRYFDLFNAYVRKVKCMLFAPCIKTTDLNKLQNFETQQHTCENEVCYFYWQKVISSSLSLGRSLSLSPFGCMNLIEQEKLFSWLPFKSYTRVFSKPTRIKNLETSNSNNVCFSTTRVATREMTTLPIHKMLLCVNSVSKCPNVLILFLLLLKENIDLGMTRNFNLESVYQLNLISQS